MKVTLYRYEKGTLVMRSVEMEKLQAALRTENLNKPISTTRDKVMFALPGTQNSDIQNFRWSFSEGLSARQETQSLPCATIRDWCCSK